MTKIKIILALLALAMVTTVAKAGVKEIGIVNGVHLVRVRTASIFAPSSTVILSYTPGQPGVDVVSQVGGAGVVPSVATAGGIVGGAALLRPARSSNSANAGASGGGGGAGVISGQITTNGGNAGGNGGFTPPGHVNNPSQNN